LLLLALIDDYRNDLIDLGLQRRKVGFDRLEQ